MFSNFNADKYLIAVLIFFLSLSAGYLPLSVGLRFDPILGLSLQDF